MKSVEIDLRSIMTNAELHETLAKCLGFPGWYGRNWDAFWDAITGLVEMPNRLALVGYNDFALRLPDEAIQLSSCLSDMMIQYPELDCKVVYLDDSDGAVV